MSTVESKVFSAALADLPPADNGSIRGTNAMRRLISDLQQRAFNDLRAWRSAGDTERLLSLKFDVHLDFLTGSYVIHWKLLNNEPPMIQFVPAKRLFDQPNALVEDLANEFVAVYRLTMDAWKREKNYG